MLRMTKAPQAASHPANRVILNGCEGIKKATKRFFANAQNDKNNTSSVTPRKPCHPERK